MSLALSVTQSVAVRTLPTQLRGDRVHLSFVPKSRAHQLRTKVSRGPVVALFGFGAPPIDPKAKYVCVDCGYIYDGGDFSKEPNSYQCPYCTSKKSRFKKYTGKSKAVNSAAARTARFKAKEW